MPTSEIKVISGDIRQDVFGSWSDCSPGLYIDHDLIETVFSQYRGKRVKVTIEVIDNVEESN